MQTKVASYAIALSVSLVMVLALAPSSSAEHCWEAGLEEDEATATYDNCRGLTVEVGDDVSFEDVRDELTAPAEHCWSAGAEVGVVWVDQNPCNDTYGFDTSNPDNVVIYAGYAEHEIVDGPL